MEAEEHEDFRARDLDALRDMLHHGAFHVMPVESCSVMEKVAGLPCLRQTFEDSAAASGMVSLAANGVKLARTGAVSLAEVYRACM